MKVTSVYGLTETAPGMTATRIDDSFDVRCNTVGRDFEFTEVRVIDPETGEECPVGVQGEMCNRGYNTMKGYYKNEEATREVFTEDGWLKTGDLGTIDANGFIYIRGRSKTMLLSSNGQNIFPEEIEAKLNNMPFVLESLIIERNKKLVALVYPDYDSLDSLGLNTPDNIKTVMDENLKNLNKLVGNYEQVSTIQLYPTEFEKTPKKSIKRFLYNSIAEE